LLSCVCYQDYANYYTKYQDYAKTTERIFTKFGGKMTHGPRSTEETVKFWW